MATARAMLLVMQEPGQRAGETAGKDPAGREGTRLLGHRAQGDTHTHRDIEAGTWNVRTW